MPCLPLAAPRALRGRLALSTLLAGIALPGLALAQEAIDLDTVVVEAEGLQPFDGGTGYTAAATATGMKAGAALTEVPATVDVVTQSELRDRDPVQLEDAIAYVPGIAASNWGVDDRFDQFEMRGVDLGTSGIFRDGLSQKALNFSGFKIDPYLIERIDVLKGPAGVLYGENEAAGLVNVITKRPSFDTAREGYLSYGSHDTVELGTDMTGALSKDGTLAYRVVAVARDGANATKGSEDDRLMFAPSLTWAPDAATSVTIFAQVQKDSAAPNNFEPVPGVSYDASLGELGESYDALGARYNRFETEQWALGWSAEHKFSPAVTLRQNFRYASQDTDYRHFYYGYMEDDTTASFAAFSVDETATRGQADTQLQFDSTFAGGRNTVLAGLDLSRETVDGTQGYDTYSVSLLTQDFGFDPAADPAVYVDQKQVTDRAGLYVQDLVRFDNGMNLSFGARRSRVKSEVEDRLAGTTTSADYDATVGSIGLTWELPNGFSPYIGYSEGFTVNSGTDAEGNLYDPSTSKQVELGLKWASADGRRQATASVFDMTRQNVLTTPLGGLYAEQTGEVSYKGIELSARGAITDRLSLIGSYAHLDAEITSAEDGTEGNRPANSAKDIAAIWLDYDWGAVGPGSLQTGLGLRYVGPIWGDDGNTLRVNSHTLADLSLRYRIERTTVALSVTNLMDEDYSATCDTSAGCIAGEGREMTLTLSRAF